MADSKKWYCVVISSTAYYGKTESVVEELKGVLHPNISDIVVVNEPEIVKTGEYFIFVSSKNFLKKKESVEKLSCVLRIQSSGNTPYCFSDKDVSGFLGSIEKKGKCVEFKKGDVVMVREGYLKNLFGLVCGNKNGKVNVLFRFYVRDFKELLDGKNLKYDKNIFELMPSNIDRNDWFKKFSE